MEVVSKEWKEVRLGDVIEFNPKETIKKGTISKKIGMEMLNPFQRKIEGFEVTEYKSGTKFRNGDTLLARITPCLENGKTAQVTILDENEIGFGSTEFIVLRQKTKYTVNDFIYYLAISPMIRETAIKSMTGTSGRQRAQRDVIENTTFKIPPLKEQKAIAHILSTLDEKIEINNQINKKLEEIAQTIFKNWFIDFEFPNEDGEPYKSSGGEMVESELGMIPKGWEVEDLYSIADVIYGAPFSSKLFNEEGKGLPLIRIRDLKTFTPQFYTTESHVNASIIEPGNILIGMDAEFKPTIWIGQKGYLNQRVCHIKSNKSYVHDYYLYELIKPYMEFFEFSKVGTTVIHLSKKDINSIRIIQASNSLLSQYSDIVNPIHEKIVLLSKENIMLASLRDTLLPKLMSGEIRVPLESEDDIS